MKLLPFILITSALAVAPIESLAQAEAKAAAAPPPEPEYRPRPVRAPHKVPKSHRYKTAGRCMKGKVWVKGCR